MMRVKVILNPAAGSFKGRQAEHLIKKSLYQRGWDLDLAKTSSSKESIKIAKDSIKQNFDLIIAAGGDGTVNDVINGMLGSEIPLGIIPLGTANVFAREMNIPLDYRKACEFLHQAEAIPIDIGIIKTVAKSSKEEKANKSKSNNKEDILRETKGLQEERKIFLLMAGIGFDAEVVNTVNAENLSKKNQWTYIKAGFTTLFQYKYPEIKLKIYKEYEEGKTTEKEAEVDEGYLAVISNSSLYGGDYILNKEAKMDDGYFDIFLYKQKGFFNFLKLFFNIYKGKGEKHINMPGVKFYKAQKVHVYSPQGELLPVQADGDPIGMLPMDFLIKKHAIYIVVKPKS